MRAKTTARYSCDDSTPFCSHSIQPSLHSSHPGATPRTTQSAPRRSQEELARETYIMSTCTHPNIARIFGLTREPSTGIPSIIMKFYKRGSLLDVMCGASAPNSAPNIPGRGSSLSGASVGGGLMSTGGSGVQGSAGALALSIVARIRLARGIARGMAYLHERPNEAITHGNLNPRCGGWCG